MEQAGKEKAVALMGNQSGNECWEAEYEATNNLAESVCEVDGQVPLQAVTTAQTVPSPVDTPFFGDRVGWITINEARSQRKWTCRDQRAFTNWFHLGHIEGTHGALELQSHC